MSSEAIPLRRVRVELGAALERALEPLFRQARDAEIGLRLALPSTRHVVFVDEAKVLWAVTALVGNALRYARRGTRLTPSGNVEVTVRSADDAIAIDVRDDGPGLPRAAAAVLRGADDQASTAPALALVREIVCAHGGTVVLETSRDPDEHGTRIELRIPHPA